MHVSTNIFKVSRCNNNNNNPDHWLLLLIVLLFQIRGFESSSFLFSVQPHAATVSTVSWQQGPLMAWGWQHLSGWAPSPLQPPYPHPSPHPPSSSGCCKRKQAPCCDGLFITTVDEAPQLWCGFTYFALRCFTKIAPCLTLSQNVCFLKNLFQVLKNNPLWVFFFSSCKGCLRFVTTLRAFCLGWLTTNQSQLLARSKNIWWVP